MLIGPGIDLPAVATAPSEWREGRAADMTGAVIVSGTTVYGGIHFRSANEDGLAAGVAIGQWTFAHYLQPKTNRSRK
jgi:hypothetical protein